jgi:heme/copper-type cytochrome/quinol oxidase subunit 3
VTADSTHDGPRALRVVRAAQLRARARRGAIWQILLASTFLVGALAYARAPDHDSDQSLLWMTGLLVLSMIDFGLGTRTLARMRRAPPRAWMAATAAWGILSTVVVGFLLRG